MTPPTEHSQFLSFFFFFTAVLEHLAGDPNERGALIQWVPAHPKTPRRQGQLLALPNLLQVSRNAPSKAPLDGPQMLT
jgi:hypothetical protein